MTESCAIFNHLLEKKKGAYFTFCPQSFLLAYSDHNFNMIFGVEEHAKDILLSNSFQGIIKKIQTELNKIKTSNELFAGMPRFSFDSVYTAHEASFWLRFTFSVVSDVLHCYVENINEQINLEEEFEDFRDQNQILLDLSEEIMFEYDIQAGSMMFTGKAVYIFNFNNYMPDFAEEVARRELICKEDLPIFERLLENMKNHVEMHEEFRVRDKNDDMQWCRVSYRIFQRQDGRVLAVGKFTNIATERALMVKAETDSMTGLLNKGSVEYKISECFEEMTNPVQQHFLMILDIDNFKGVNDTYGHMQGDMVIKKVAEQLKKNFRNSDILGRIGGDEFVVFLKNCASQERVHVLANNLLQGIHDIYADPDKTKPVAVSIGIACHPNNGHNFSSLYETADKALYQSKLQGKNRYSFYNG